MNVTLSAEAGLFFLRATLLLAVFWAVYVLLASHPRARVLLCRIVSVTLVLLPLLSFAPLPVLLKLTASTPAEIAAFTPPASTTPAQSPAPPTSQHPPSPALPAGVIDHETPSPVPTADLAALGEKTPTRPLPEILITIWLTGILLLLTRWLIALAFSHRLAAKAHAPPPWVTAACVQFGTQLGLRAPVKLAITDHVCSPLLLGPSPVILLPGHLFSSDEKEDIAPALAHELVHVRRHDWYWSQWLHLVAALTWPLPLVWFLRRAHDAASEWVCDHLAAQAVGGADAYAGSLARQSLHAIGHPRLATVPMLRRSGIRQRIERLLAGTGLPLLSRNAVGLALLLVLMVAGALGGIRLARAEIAAPQEPVTTPAGPLTITCVDDKGAPVPGAMVYLIETLKNPATLSLAPPVFIPSGPRKADASGKAVFNDVVTFGNREWRRSVYARVHGKLAGGIYRVSLSQRVPDDSHALTVTLLPVQTITAQVEVPPGFDVQKVKVTVLTWFVGGPGGNRFLGEVRNPGKPQPWPSLVEFYPDAQGRVAIPDVPAGAYLYLGATLPGLAEAQHAVFGVKNPPEEFKLSLDQAAVIEGTVRGPAGKGVPHALLSARLSHSSGMVVTHRFYTYSDDQGHYRIDGLPAGQIEVQMAPPGDLLFRPRNDITIEKGQTTHADLTVGPGVWVTGQVQDQQTGKGIPKVDLCFVGGDLRADGDAYASVITDDAGNFRIKLPEGTSTSYVSDFPRTAYLPPPEQAKSLFEVTAGPPMPPKIFTLVPRPAGLPSSPFGAEPAVARGRVVDPAGKPLGGVEISSFYTPDKGIDTFPQQNGHETTGSDGTYTIKVLPYGTCAIWAGGDTTNRAISKEFPVKPGSQHQIEDLAVRPANASLSGKVVDEKGTPVSNVRVDGISASKSTGHLRVSTDLEGRFTLAHVMDDEVVSIQALGPNASMGTVYASPGDTDAVIVLHSSGYTRPPATPHPLPDLLDKPAPPWSVETWVQTPSGPPAPVRSDGQWTLFVILRSPDHANIAYLKDISDMAARLHARAVVIFGNQFSASLVRGVLAQQELPIDVGVDGYIYDQDNDVPDGITHMAYRGGSFLIDPAGIVRGMERIQPVASAEPAFKAIMTKAGKP